MACTDEFGSGDEREQREPQAEVSLGVGDGSGNLFVQGSYEAITMCQSKLFRMESAERTVRSISTMLGWRNPPPQRTIEADLRALRVRLERSEARERRLKQALQEALMYISECNMREVVPEMGPAYDEAMALLESGE